MSSIPPTATATEPPDASSFTTLPMAVLDLQDFHSTDQHKRQAFVQQLGDSFARIGFAAVRNSAFDSGLQQSLFQEMQGFFALPEAVKRRYIVAGARGQRGFSQFGSEQAKGEKTPDLKEFWQHGQTHAENDPLARNDFANVVVRECPDFTPTLEQGYRALEATGASLLQAIALYLGLAQDFFTPHIRGGLSILRAIYYPPISQEPESSVRAAAHEDINLITLLMGASAAGLEVKNASGTWLPIHTPPDFLVINVGDMLQRLSNQRLRSTTHRVVNPPHDSWHKPRYSLPFFLHPRPEMSLACLPSTVNAQNPKRFADCTAAEYLDERLREIRTH